MAEFVDPSADRIALIGRLWAGQSRPSVKIRRKSPLLRRIYVVSGVTTYSCVGIAIMCGIPPGRHRALG